MIESGWRDDAPSKLAPPDDVDRRVGEVAGRPCLEQKLQWMVESASLTLEGGVTGDV
jgi:hypothetical protein